ncbi:MAG: hypothetical protein AAGH17_04995 [Pseudomonadota bacterium]
MSQQSTQAYPTKVIPQVTAEEADELARAGLQLAASRVVSQMLENANAHMQRVQVLTEAIYAIAAEKTKSGKPEEAGQLMELVSEISKGARDDFEFAVSQAAKRGLDPK